MLCYAVIYTFFQIVMMIWDDFVIPSYVCAREKIRSSKYLLLICDGVWDGIILSLYWICQFCVFIFVALFFWIFYVGCVVVYVFIKSIVLMTSETKPFNTYHFILYLYVLARLATISGITWKSLL
jgi:hypothetical protein